MNLSFFSQKKIQILSPQKKVPPPPQKRAKKKEPKSKKNKKKNKFCKFLIFSLFRYVIYGFHLLLKKKE